MARRNSRGDSVASKMQSAVENWSTALRVLSTKGVRCRFRTSFSIQYLRVLSAVLARWKIKAVSATETGSYI